MLEKRLNKYAEVLVKSGLNVQKGQPVVIRSSAENAFFVRKVVEKAYEAGAGKVIVEWNDPYIQRLHFEHQSEEQLCEIKDYAIEEQKDHFESGSCFLSLTSPIPEIMKGIDSKKIAARNKAFSNRMQAFAKYTSANLTQWCVAAVSNPVWANKVFENDPNANEKLWDAILSATHVDENNDPVKEWEKHNAQFRQRIEKLNGFDFKQLHFKNKKGTDLKVDLAPHHIWAGGCEKTQKTEIIFNPNMPTEEIFTMPYRDHVNGIVYATKPLDFNGNLIEDFYFEFKDGRVINYGAKKSEDALKELVEFDEGSHYIGEVALVPYHSPISEMNVLFYNTLFDENASCHLALGRAYEMTVQGGENMSKEELKKAGANDSLLHVDFMFGSEDMEVTGITWDNKEIKVMEKGDFVI